MHDIAGLVALAVIGLWIAYLVPHRLRYRQQLLESRTEDRFSDALRVLAVTDARRRAARAVEARAECGPDRPKRSELLSPARGVPVGASPAVTEGRGGVVERPYGTQDKLSADDARRAAQLRARRAASVARRAAAARRRALLTGVLLAASAIAWAVVGLTSLAVTAAVVPTVLLGGVLLLGRHAVVAGRRADEAWERQQRERAEALLRPAAPRARVTGRAHHPSESHTEAIARVGADTRPTERSADADAPADRAASEGADEDSAPADADADRPAADAQAGPTAPEPSTVTAPVEVGGATAEPSSDGWSPVPVPRPTYTTKATAPRREPLPLVVDEPTHPVTAEAAPEGDAGTSDSADAVTSAAPPVDLDAILARRRAAGE